MLCAQPPNNQLPPCSNQSQIDQSLYFDFISRDSQYNISKVYIQVHQCNTHIPHLFDEFKVDCILVLDGIIPANF